MFYSQCLLSRKGPLGAIWVAAYCFNKLKKAQVFETDIPASVDKILQDELEILAYRVLAYLLVGVVRIYSKKVEYLFDDCHEVLKKINEFMAREKKESQKQLKQASRAPYFSITLPESFELDAFQFDILEDINEDNVLPHEEITIKDLNWRTEGTGQCSHEEYYCEHFAAYCDTCSMDDNNQTEENLSSLLMDIDTGAKTSHDKATGMLLEWNIETNMEKLQYNRSNQKDCLQPESFCRLEQGEHIEVPEEAGSENHIGSEAGRENYDENPVQEIFMNCRSVSIQESLGPIQPFNDNQNGGKKVKGQDRARSETEMQQVLGENCNLRNLEASAEKLCDFPQTGQKGQDRARLETEMQQVLGENCNLRNLEASAEKLRDNGFPQTGQDRARLETEMQQVLRENCNLRNLEASAEKLRDNGFPQTGQNESLEPITPFVKEHRPDAKLINLPEITTSKNAESAKDHPLSVTIDATPQSKLPEASGAATPELMVIPTPAAKERGRLSRKRKSLFDEETVIPNNVMRLWIKNASDLVYKRRKSARTPPVAWMTRRVSNLSKVFAAPLVPCTSELRSLNCEKNLEVLESVQILEPEEIGVSEPVETAETSKEIGESSEPVVPAENFDGSESLHIPTSFEKTEIAPQTPAKQSTLLRSFKSPEDLRFYKLDGAGLEHSIENMEKEPCPSKHHELDFNLMNEDALSCEGENEKQDEWSGRTRKVANFLLRSFQAKEQRGEEETMNLFQLLEGKKRKESALFFYEILVLKTKAIVDVEQSNAYDDIVIRRASQGEEM